MRSSRKSLLPRGAFNSFFGSSVLECLAFLVPIGPIVVPFLGLPYRILHMNPKKELLWGLRCKHQLKAGVGELKFMAALGKALGDEI